MSLLSEFNAIKKKKDRIIAKSATNLFPKLVKITPVKKGNLKASWTIDKKNDGWLINNSALYASIVLRKREKIRGKTYGSEQFPDGIEPIIKLADKKLQQELKDI